MAYQAKRRKQFIEDLELTDVDGNVVHTLHVSLDTDDMVPRLTRKYTALIRAQAETAEAKRKAETAEEVTECFEKLGHAVTDLFEAVFGEEDTKTIIAFYDGRYIEMIKEITPFITKCVIPRCMEIKKENQNSILSAYNRKQRRAFFKKVK